MSSADMQNVQLVGLLRQQMLQQQTVFLMKITDMAFDKCVKTPREQLSSSEEHSIRGTMKKYTDTQKMVLKRYQSQVQASQELK